MRQALSFLKTPINKRFLLILYNENDGKTLIKYKGYSYYKDNPALSIQNAVKMLFSECGI